MGLKIKSMYVILKDLIDWTTSRTDKITDFNIGSGIRTIYEAVSIQLEEFYFRMKQNTLFAIENAIFIAFNFNRKVAVASHGTVSVIFVKPLEKTLIIPKGTIFSTNDMYGYTYFESTEEVQCQKGLLNAMVKVKCQKDGNVGNVPAGSITIMIPDNQNVKSVYNIADFTNGRDAETTAEHKKRFQFYINTLSKATAKSVLYGALQVPEVSGAWVDDNYIGYVKLYVHNSDGELPESLKTAVKIQMNDYRAAGIEIEVLPIVKVKIEQNIKVMINDDFDVEVYSRQIKEVVIAFLNDYSVGTDYFVSDVIHHIRSCYEGIVINVEVHNSDRVIQKNELVRPGTINVTCINKKNWRNKP